VSVGETNSRTWAHRRFVRHYRATDLRPVEAQILARYDASFSGRVLELGCGTGRATGHLAARSAQVEAIDLSPAMIAEAEKRHPGIEFHLLDMSDLSHFDSGSFDAVIATCNVIDVLDDDQRQALIAEVRRLLGEKGIFVFSSHNRGHIEMLREPWQMPNHPTHRFLAFGKAILRLPVRLRNRRRLNRFEVHAADYEILNDAAHDWRLLQYYIFPADSRRQLADHGLQMLECAALDGRPIDDDDQAREEAELYYVARPV
jgi:SAM-dependent methyltransferase